MQVLEGKNCHFWFARLYTPPQPTSMPRTAMPPVVPVFRQEGNKLSAAFQDQLAKAKSPIIIVAYGRTGSGKSTLLNQLLVGVQEDMTTAEYEEPFATADDATPQSISTHAAIVRLKDLLVRHRAEDILDMLPQHKGAQTRCLTGEEEVFVVDTEGLQAAVGHTPYLFAQLWALLDSAACCLWVQRGSRPTVDDFVQLFSVVKMSTRSAQIMVGQLCKDLLTTKRGETPEQMMRRCVEQRDTILRMVGGSEEATAMDKSVADMVRDHELVVECFPNMFQADNPKGGAKPAYWGTLQHLLEQLCHHLCHIQLPPGTEVASTIQEQVVKLSHLENIADVDSFAQLYAAIATSDVCEVLLKQCGELKEKFETLEVEELEQVLHHLVHEPGNFFLDLVDGPLWAKLKDFAEHWPGSWDRIAIEHAAKVKEKVNQELRLKRVLNQVVVRQKEFEAEMKAQLEATVQTFIAQIDLLQKEIGLLGGKKGRFKKP